MVDKDDVSIVFSNVADTKCLDLQYVIFALSIDHLRLKDAIFYLAIVSSLDMYLSP